MSDPESRRAALRQILDDGRAAARTVQKHVVERVKQAMEPKASLATTHDRLQTSEPDPPVVARLVVEIRSDGSRTIARGAMEDVATGERVAIQADGKTPAQLAGALARSILTMPLMAAQAFRAVQRGQKTLEDDDHGATGD